MLLLCTTFGQAQTGPYVRVKFEATKAQLLKISKDGVDLEHLTKTGKYLFLEVSREEMQTLRKTIKSIELVETDLSTYYANRALIDLNKNTENSMNVVPPPGFKLGSMGGFLTYSEMVSMLDSMRRKYPTLISVKKSIGNTLENNVQYVVKISDNPDKEEAQEKQVLYDAMHHAREPQAMMQMMYYMWYIMDRYVNQDPLAKYIIDNRELYFIPIVNPDGYLYNQSTNPNGGGMWRKNRSSNSDGTRGVDLNRNYSYDWGYDDNGSSPQGNSNTFRGPSAFSEPETQNMRNFVNSKKIKSNLSYHTFGGYLIYPFGAKENYYTPDSTMFRLYADSLTKENGYSAGTVFETLNYFANGGSCDWMYGDTSHSKIFSFTPEVGFSNDGFWPLPSRIIPLCEENIAPNLSLATYALNGLDVNVEDTIFTQPGIDQVINVSYFSAGLESNKKIKSYLEFSDPNLIINNSDTLNISGINTFGYVDKTFNIKLGANTNDTISYRIVTQIGQDIQYDSSRIIIMRGFGINKNAHNLVSIFPNPSSSFIQIETKQDFDLIEIYNSTGKLISKNKSIKVDVQDLKTGVYFVSIKLNNKIVGIGRFVKQ